MKVQKKTLSRAAMFALGLSTAFAAFGEVGSLSIADASIKQPSSGEEALEFTVTRSGFLGFPITVPYATANGTATSGSDYTETTGSLSFAADASTATISVPVLSGSNTADKTFSLKLTAPSEVAEDAIPPSAIALLAPIAQGDSRDVVEADFNGDGKPDLASGTTANGTFLRNTTVPGSRSPSYSTTGSFPDTGIAGVSMQAVDVNGDGLQDLIYAATGANHVNVMINITAVGADDFSFQGPATIPLAEGQTARKVLTGDFNGDGRPDVAVLSNGAVQTFVNQTLLTDSEIFFESTAFVEIGGATDFTTADVDGDGRLDLAITQQTDGYVVSILRNTGVSGSIELESAGSFEVGEMANHLKAADFNLDGRIDFTFLSDDGLQILFNTTEPNGPLNFSLRTVPSIGGTRTDVQVADFNNDGLTDIGVTSKNNNFSGTVGVFQNRTKAGSATPAFKLTAILMAPATSFARIVNANGDGKPDLLVADVNAILPGAVSKLYVAANVTLAPPPFLFSYGTATKTTSDYGFNLTAGDFNNDGKADIATADYYDTISVWLNTTPVDAAKASYAKPTTFPANGNSVYDIATADFNLDGRLDLVSVDYNDTNVNVFTNTTELRAATASFRLTETTDSEFHYSVTTGDFNNDGKPDIATGAYSGSVTVLLNTTPPGAATPTFAFAGFFNDTNRYYLDIEAGDFNGDGLLDLAFVDSDDDGGSSAQGRVSVLLNTSNLTPGTTSFNSLAQFNTGKVTYDLAVGDVNGDGRTDIVAGNYGDTDTYVLLNTTAPGASTANFDISNLGPIDGEYHYDVLLNDLDGDGKLDIATATYDSFVTVLRNTTATGASTPSFTLIGKYPVAEDPYGLVSADFNGDGQRDLASSSYNEELFSTVFNTQYRVGLERDTATGTIEPGKAPLSQVDLQLSTMADTYDVAVGDLVAYEFSVTNNGPDDAGPGTKVEVTGSSQLEVESFVAAEGVSCEQGLRSLTCSIPLLEFRLDSGITRVRFRAKAAGSATLSAAVTPATGQTNSNAENNTVTDNFDIAEADLTPDAFSFTDVTDVELGSAQESDAVEITGINVGSPFTVTGGFAKVNRGLAGFGPCTETSGTINTGDKVALCQTASDKSETKTTTTLTIGAEPPLMGVSGSFSSTTKKVVKAPAVALDVNDVGFGSGAVIRFREITLNSSETQVVTLTNTGNAPLLISGITTSGGDFRHTSTCGSSVAPAATCTISITFKPTQVGTRTGETRIVSNAVSSPDLIKLSGVGKGLVPGIKTNVTSYNFGSVKVGASSPDRALTITSSGTGPLEIRSIKLSGDFSGSHDCPKFLDAGKTCTLTGRFKPKAKGARSGNVTITTSAPDSPTVVTLSGKGT